MKGIKNLNRRETGNCIVKISLVRAKKKANIIIINFGRYRSEVLERLEKKLKAGNRVQKATDEF